MRRTDGIRPYRIFSALQIKRLPLFKGSCRIYATEGIKIIELGNLLRCSCYIWCESSESLIDKVRDNAL